jgi:hypothetical protein
VAAEAAVAMPKAAPPASIVLAAPTMIALRIRSDMS